MFVLKIIHSDGNVSLEPIGERTKVEYTKDGSPLNNLGIKAFVYNPDQDMDEQVFPETLKVGFDEEAYVIEQGKTVCVVSYGN